VHRIRKGFLARIPEGANVINVDEQVHHGAQLVSWTQQKNQSTPTSWGRLCF